MDPLLILVLAGAAAAVWYFTRRSGGVRHVETQLLRICHGNEAQAERLIEGEMARAPGITRAEAASRAVARYRRDNR